MNRKGPHLLRSNDQYRAQMAVEETKLRWLIDRQPNSLELRYYLIFLLVANERYVKAVKECQRILTMRPNDLVAQMWAELVRLRWFCASRRRASFRPSQLKRIRRWHHVCRKSSESTE